MYFLNRRSQRASALSDAAGRVRLCRSGIFPAAGAEEGAAEFLEQNPAAENPFE